jgi:hypothetical protein
MVDVDYNGHWLAFDVEGVPDFPDRNELLMISWVDLEIVEILLFGSGMLFE